MDLRNPTRFRPSPAGRFIAVFHASSSASASATADEDLSEDDIFSSVDNSCRGLTHSHRQIHPTHHRGASSSSSSPAFSPPVASSSGILAALPDNGPHPIFNHKASSVSSASSSSVASLSPSSISASRLIPSVPRPPPALNERFLGKYHQSAPVNVPVLTNLRWRGDGGIVDDEFNEVEEEEEGEDEVMCPPHEIVTRRSERFACSVLEGAGRTLKGRDLRQVRNAVWRQTGFLD